MTTRDINFPILFSGSAQPCGDARLVEYESDPPGIETRSKFAHPNPFENAAFPGEAEDPPTVPTIVMNCT